MMSPDALPATKKIKPRPLSTNQKQKAERNPSKMFWDSSAKGTYVKKNIPKE